jgi:CDP-6-deoxy-D-xylo-4-hexulose-3-dehydrase
MVEGFASESLKMREFVPGETVLPVSGKVLDASDISALVDASLDGWLTAGRFHKEFEKALEK